MNNIKVAKNNTVTNKDYRNYIALFLKIFTFFLVILFLYEYYIIRSNFQHEISTQIHEQHNIQLNTQFNNTSTLSKLSAYIKEFFTHSQVIENGGNEGEEKKRENNWMMVITLTLISSLAAGLGGVPFFFVRELSPFYISLSNAIASGLMISACISLVIDGIEYSGLYTFGGVIIGFIFIRISEKVLENYEDIKVGGLQGIDAKKAFLFVCVMTVHSFAEGVGMGMSFGGGQSLGLCVCIAIAIHNIPEGIAVCLVLIPKGISPLRSSLWSAITSLPQPLMALPAYLFVETFYSFLPWGLGFASGAMVYMVFSELIPDALEGGGMEKRFVFIIIIFSIVLMSLFQVLLELLIHS